MMSTKFLENDYFCLNYLEKENEYFVFEIKIYRIILVLIIMCLIIYKCKSIFNKQ